MAREQELFIDVVQKTLKHADELLLVAQTLAEIDLFSSWEKFAGNGNIVCLNF